MENRPTEPIRRRTPHRSARLRPAWAALVAAGLAVIPACSSEGTASTTSESTSTSEESTTSAAPAGQPEEGLEEYCALAVQLTEQDGPPTEEQLREYQSLAPDEVAEPIGAIVEAFSAAGGNMGAIFSDPAAASALDELTAFEEEHCGMEADAADPAVTQLDPDATRVELSATDFAFDTDYPTTAGRYSFAISNDGAEPHLAILVQLEDGATLEQALASEGEEGVAVAFESDVIPPGGEGFLSVDLTAGDWVLVCPIPDAEGTSHAEHGMVHEFTVQ